MPVASLVLTLVVGLWAAYLLPQWVRRREALGQSRTNDRHSQRLRVLPRRPRGVRVAGGPSTSPLLTGTRVEVAPFDGPPVRAGARALGRPKPLPSAVADPSAATASGAVTASVSSGASGDAARRRATVLLVLVVVAVTSWAAVLLPAVGAPAWVAVPATALLALDVLALRAAARRRAGRLAAERRRAAAAPARRAVQPEPVVGRSRTVRPAGSSARSAATASGRAGVPRPARTPVPAPVVAGRPDWADRRWEDETGEIVGIERPNPLAADDGWAPVAVPQPTYLLKPVVERPKPRPWTPERDFGDDLDLDAVLARRRAVNG